MESRGDRMAMAEDAGFGPVSPMSVLAGTLVAYGCFAVLFAIAGGIASATGVTDNLSTGDWRTVGMGSGIVVACILFASYLFGGYSAGRMARRAGMSHGLLVFLTGIAVAAVAGAVARQATDADSIIRSLRDLGVPTSGTEWRDIGIVTAAGSLIAMLLGSLVGGVMGERWHATLLARAIDPEIGAEADARRKAEAGQRDAAERHTSASDRVRQARGDILPGKNGDDRDENRVDLRERTVAGDVDDTKTTWRDVDAERTVTVGKHMSAADRVERARADAVGGFDVQPGDGRS